MPVPAMKDMLARLPKINKYKKRKKKRKTKRTSKPPRAVKQQHAHAMLTYMLVFVPTLLLFVLNATHARIIDVAKKQVAFPSQSH